MRAIAQRNIASIEVHAQKAFTPLCEDELPIPDGDKIVDELNRQAKYAQFRIGSKEAHNLNAHWIADDKHPVHSKISGSSLDIRWPPHAIVGTQGFEAIDGLPHPTAYDYFVWQGIELDMHPYGICYHDLTEKLSTGLIEFLKMNRVASIIVGGLATEFCVKTSVLQLINAGFDVYLNKKATRGLNIESAEQAISLMREHGAFILNSCDEFISDS